MSNDNKPIQRTVLLDTVTITILQEYGLSKSGSKNVSGAIRSLTREFASIEKGNTNE